MTRRRPQDARRDALRASPDKLSTQTKRPANRTLGALNAKEDKQ